MEADLAKWIANDLNRYMPANSTMSLDDEDILRVTYGNTLMKFKLAED